MLKLLLFASVLLTFISLNDALFLEDEKDHILDISSSYNEPIIMARGCSLLITTQELNIDGDNGDYLLIRRGIESDTESTGIILTHMLNKERKFVIHSNEVYIDFVANSKESHFKLVYRRIGTPIVTTTESPEISSPFPTPGPTDSTSATVYVSGKAAAEYLNETTIRNFRDAVAKMATEYCTINNWILKENITYANVHIQELKHCPYNWPQSENCVVIVYALPIFLVDEQKGYQFSTSHLNIMWERYSRKYLALYAFKYYEITNSGKVVRNWNIITGVMLGVFLLLIAAPFIKNGISKKCRKLFNQNSPQQIGIPEKRKDIKPRQTSFLGPDIHQPVPPIYNDPDNDAQEDEQYTRQRTFSSYDNDDSDDDINHTTFQFSHDNEAFESSEL